MTRELGRLAGSIAGAPVTLVSAVRGRLGGGGPRDGVRELWDLSDFCDIHYSAEREAELERRLEELDVLEELAGLDEREGRSAGSRELERRLEEMEELEDLAELEGRGAGWSERGWR